MTGVIDPAAAADTLVATLGDPEARIVAVTGEGRWHSHATVEELAVVVRGAVRVEYRDRPASTLGIGQMCVLPRGVEHRPVSPEGYSLLLVRAREAA